MTALTLDTVFQDAVLAGHFQLSSGLHSDRYVQCAQVLQYPHRAEAAGRLLAAKIPLWSPECIVGPALGGVIVAHEVARACGLRALFTERNPEGRMLLRRGFALEPGERVVVVEDVVTTGKSALEAALAVREAGGEVVGFACLVERGNNHALSPLASLWQVAPAHYQPEACPLCQQAIPLVKPGSRHS